MCWSKNVSLIMTITGSLLGYYSYYHIDKLWSISVFYFTLMQLIHYLGYIVIDQCSNTFNYILTYANYIHIAFQPFFSSLGLLSIKPKIIVCNVDEESLAKGNKFTESVKQKYPNEKIVTICADIEDQIMGLDNNERETFMREIGLNKTGLNQLIKEGYDLLSLDTFFTSGPEESRAWTVEKNTLAPKAASVIHTDFEKNFIRAEAVTCEDFIKFGSAEKCKENGKLRIEGKDYIVKDGDVLYFRVNP